MTLKKLLEQATRKCEMRWKVLAFNPKEDNKLVKEFNDFDCIDCAQAKKREYLEKNPEHIVEIIAESTQMNGADFYKSPKEAKEALELILAYLEKREYIHAKDLIKALIKSIR